MIWVEHADMHQGVQVQGLSQPASRALLSALVRASKSHPRAIVHELILPLVRTEDLGSAQVPRPHTHTHTHTHTTRLREGAAAQPPARHTHTH
jgi:hypothetical protein